jgi:hypothetical protein
MAALMRKVWAISIASIAFCLVVGCGSSLPGPPSNLTVTTPAPPLTGPGLVTISGIQLMRDGKAWTPRGVQLNAFVATPAAQYGEYLAAYESFSPAELTGIVAWGADTVRFQIGQPGLDPQSSYYSAAWVATVQAAVEQARSDKLSVILSMQDQSQTGEPSPASLPDAGTIRAWMTLTSLFNGDQGVVYEIFNEPEGSATTSGWTAWQAAHQAVVTAIRATGSKNVLLADGLEDATTLAGAPPLSDALNATGYAVHPFFLAATGYETPTDFAANFGSIAATNVVVATEWSTHDTDYCDVNTPAASQALLTYLLASDIGVVGFAYDDPGYGANAGYIGNIVLDYSGTPTTFDGGRLTCGEYGFGPGVMLQTAFKTGVVPAP